MDRRRLEMLVTRSLSEVDSAGLAVSVATGSATVRVCRGQVAGARLTPSTLMYGASLTKQIIGYLAALSVERGRLGYHDRILDILPHLPPWLGAVRIRHLLHHTSGVPEVTGEPSGPQLDNVGVLDHLRNLSVEMITPGRRYAYSNTGYVLLAEAVAMVEGHPHDRLARRMIFEPLGMAGSRLGGPAVAVPGHPDPPPTVGDGGWWTSLDDLTTWLSALNHRRPDAAAGARLVVPGTLDDGSALDYGWGVRVTGGAGVRVVTHGGSWPSWLAKTVRYPDQGVAVAVLSQGGDERAVSQLGLELARHAAVAERSRLPSDPP